MPRAVLGVPPSASFPPVALVSCAAMILPAVSVVVSVYRRADFLRLVLGALARQSDQEFEVVIAEDDENANVAACVQAFRPVLRDRLLHVRQEDLGFRKSQILNKALRASRAPLVVFIDGDCVPHRSFVHAYRRAATRDAALYGRRVMLGPVITRRLLDGELPCPPSYLDLLRSDSRQSWQAVRFPLVPRRYRPTGIWGCNWGVLRSHLENVNGFDEDYIGAGVGEDVDVEWRLKVNGVRLKSMKHRAIVYHLHHPRAYSLRDEARNYKLLADKQRSGRIRPENGLYNAASNPPAAAGGAW
jgi:GT2 family glycosyltransferase